MTSRRKTRELAFIALYQLEVGRHEPEILIEEFIYRETIDTDSRPFFRALVRGAWGKRELLDALIDAVAAGWRVERLAKVELSILRLAAYELIHPVAGEKGDPAVVINEAVVYGKRYAGEESGKFINGILGKIAALPNPLEVAAAALERPKDAPERRAFTQVLKGTPQPGVRPVSGGPPPLKGEAQDQLPSGPPLPEAPRQPATRRPLGRPTKFEKIRRPGPEGPHDRGPRPGGGAFDRGPRPQGERPYRRDEGARTFDRGPRPEGNRFQGERRSGDRPGGGRPYGAGRPGDRPGGDRRGPGGPRGPRRDDRPRPYRPDAPRPDQSPVPMENPGPAILDRTTQADTPAMPPTPGQSGMTPAPESQAPAREPAPSGAEGEKP